jgi:amidohydrolase
MKNRMTRDFYEELTRIRRELHRIPELSGEEYETTAYLRRALESRGIRVNSSGLKNGLSAELGSRERGAAVALRCDIDGLPVRERTRLPFASIHDGKMHACGHDFHQAALLGAAFLLKPREDEIPGLLRLIFQSGEESAWGSKEVVEAGYLDDIKVIVGLHNHPAYPAGTIAIKEGAMMAGVDHFLVTLIGKGGHAAEPHTGVDVITALASVINQLQTIVSRNADPSEAVVLSVTRVEAGDTWNVLPDEGFFEGTVRAFSETSRSMVKKRFYEITEAAGKAFGLEARIDFRRGPEITWNDAKMTEEVKKAMEGKADIVTATPSNAGEDFATYLKYAPGVFAFIGVNGDEGAPRWHSGDFIVKDEALPVAVNYFVESGLHLLRYFQGENERKRDME